MRLNETGMGRDHEEIQKGIEEEFHGIFHGIFHTYFINIPWFSWACTPVPWEFPWFSWLVGDHQELSPFTMGLPSGKRLHSYGKSPCLMGKLTINNHFYHFSR